MTGYNPFMNSSAPVPGGRLSGPTAAQPSQAVTQPSYPARPGVGAPSMPGGIGPGGGQGSVASPAPGSQPPMGAFAPPMGGQPPPMGGMPPQAQGMPNLGMSQVPGQPPGGPQGGFNPSQPSVTGNMGGGVSGFGQPGGGAWGRGGPFSALGGKR